MQQRQSLHRNGLLSLLGGVVLLLCALGLASQARAATPAAGPLVVSRANPRYFTVAGGDGRAVYLTGSHLWNNFVDGVGVGTCDDPAPAFDYGTYLRFLKAHNHNFIRLWTWHHSKFELNPFIDYEDHAGQFYCSAPLPWARTGAGTAWDGGPKFDLTRFDQSYFNRLRNRIVRARERGIYTSVMVFNGFCLQSWLCDIGAIEGEPFDGPNNVNGVDIDSVADYESNTPAPGVRALQKKYIRKLVDSVHDLDNALFEVTNESSTISKPWQEWVVRYIKHYETVKGYDKHPVGMVARLDTGPDGTDPPSAVIASFDGPADWISPGGDNGDYNNDPPAGDGTKVVLSDTDHYTPCEDNTDLWAWKSLTRGLSPILIDCGIGDPNNLNPDFDYLEPVRLAMGDTLKQANRMDLIATEPRGDLTSTAYALAEVGEQYLVLQPEATATPFTVTLVPGTYKVKWFDVTNRVWTPASRLRIRSAGAQSFTPPFSTAAPAVLWLQRS
jgi:hypothetical protein